MVTGAMTMDNPVANRANTLKGSSKAGDFSLTKKTTP